MGLAVLLQLPCWSMRAQGSVAAAARPAAVAQGSAAEATAEEVLAVGPAGQLQLPRWQMRALALGGSAAAIQGMHLPLRWLVGVFAAAAGRDQHACLALRQMPVLSSCLTVFLLQGMQNPCRLHTVVTS